MKSCGGHDRLSYKFSLEFDNPDSVFGNRWKMLKKILMISVIFGCLNAAAAKRPAAGGWSSIPQLDIDLVGLCVRGVNFINKYMKLAPGFR
jgi:hypothetical protein